MEEHEDVINSTSEDVVTTEDDTGGKDPLKIAEPPRDMSNVTYAGFWLRLVAFIMDAAILGIVGRIFFGGDVTSMTTVGGELSVNVDYNGWGTFIPALYTILFWVWLSSSPGKLAMGLTIVDKEGNKLSIAQSVIRYLGYIVSAIPLCLGFFWIGWDKKKRGFHDMIAGTFVVKK